MSEIKNGGLDQYGTEPFEQQQFETAGVEGVKLHRTCNTSSRDNGTMQTLALLGCQIYYNQEFDSLETR